MSDALALQTSGQTSWQRNLDALRRHAGPLLLDTLADPLTIEVALNPDGSLWRERLGEDMSRIGSLEAYRAEALLRTLAGMLNCGRATAVKIGTDAGAKIQIGRRTLYKVSIVEKYLDSLSGE